MPRKKKVVEEILTPVETSAVSETTEEIVKPAKRRGRPPKKVAEAPVEVAVEDTTPVETVTEKPAPKKRGRKKKEVAVEVAVEETPVAVVEAIPVEVAEEQARKILEDAIKNAESAKKESIISAKEEIFQMKKEADFDVKERRKEVSRLERRVTQKEETLDAKIEKVEEIYVEFIDSFQVTTKEIVQKVKEAYKADGGRVGQIKSLRIYVNTREKRAYYVINENPENKFIQF